MVSHNSSARRPQPESVTAFELNFHEIFDLKVHVKPCMALRVSVVLHRRPPKVLHCYGLNCSHSVTSARGTQYYTSQQVPP